MDDNKIVITDNNGEENVFEILFTYEDEENGNKYVMYYSEDDDEQIFAYIRRQKQEKLLTVCNFSDKNAEMEIPEEFKGAECLITNLDRTVFEGKIVLKPYEAFVLYKK